MPIPAVILTAAQNYKFNSDFLPKMVSDLKPEEWLKRPADNLNPIAWIVGHCVWTRKALLARLGTEWDKPWMGMFARGVKLDNDAAFPSDAALLDAWRESALMLDAALENASEELLARPVTQGPPSADGKMSGVVNFLATHETYHIGQASYLRAWLGYKGLMG